MEILVAFCLPLLQVSFVPNYCSNPLNYNFGKPILVSDCIVCANVYVCLL